MIRPILVAWHQVTEKLLANTQQTDEDQRDETIASIEKLLDQREKLQPKIVAPFTVEEEAFGKELVVMEADLQKKLVLFTKKIRLNMSENKSKKNHMNSYVNPYSKVGNDGAFYDTKQ